MNKAIDYQNFHKEHSHLALQDLLTRSIESVKENQLDSALAYNAMIQLRDTALLSQEEMQTMAMACSNLGYIYAICMRDEPKANLYMRRALEYAEKSQGQELIAPIYLNWANAYMRQDNLPAAIDCIKRAYTSAVENEDSKRALRAFYELIFAHEAVGAYEALIEDVKEFYNAKKFSKDPSWAFCNGLASVILNEDHLSRTELAQRLSVLIEKINWRQEPEKVKAQVLLMQARFLAEDSQSVQAKGILIGLSHDESLIQYPEITQRIFSDLERYSMLSGDTDLAREARIRGMAVMDSLLVVRQSMFENAYSLERLNNDLHKAEEQRNQQRVILAWVIPFAIVVVSLALLLYFQNRSLRFRMKKLYQLSPKSRTEKQNSGQTETNEELKKLAQRIVDFMSSDSEILSQDFTIERLTERLGAKGKQVSQAINDVLDKNFTTLLGEYRIKEACAMLTNSQYKGYTIEAIAEKVGYKSRQHFATVFRRVTGLSPSEYVRISRGNAKENG